jgi:hypothetical protein
MIPQTDSLENVLRLAGVTGAELLAFNTKDNDPINY